MNVFLEPVSGKGLKIPIDKAIIFIGRHPECDVVITRSRMISRKHCALVQINDSLLIRDLGSTNGVRVNGQRVRKEAPFTTGDTLSIGDLDYVVKAVKAAEPGRRINREPQHDVRAAGMSPPQVEPAAAAEHPYSQELPVAIPDDAEAFSDEDSDTPNSSFPLISEHEGAEKSRGVSDSDAHLPLAD